MKSIFRITSLILMVSFLAACAQPTAAPVAPATDAPPVAEAPAAAPAATAEPVVAPTDVPLSAAEQWAKDNGSGFISTCN